MSTAQKAVIVTALVLSPIRHRHPETGDLETLKPDGETEGDFTAKEAAYLASVGAIELPGDDEDAEQLDDDRYPGDPMAALVEAIGELDPENEKHFTVDGKPEVRALKEAAKFKSLSAAERDAAWAEWQKLNPPAGSGAGTESTGDADKSDAGTGEQPTND